MFPVPTHKKVTSPYGAKGSAWSGGMHRGIDFGAPRGTRVYAPWSATVTGVGTWGPAYGDRSPVFDFDRLPDGSAGLWGVIAHLDTCVVAAGDRVAAGQYIGTVGARGNATGPHVHFEVQTGPKWQPPTAGNVSRDPAKWLEALPLRQAGKVYESRMVPNQDESASVWNLQAGLRQAGVFHAERLTTFYGLLTRGAVTAFQSAAGLPVSADGIADRATVEALGLKWVPAATPPPAPEVPAVIVPAADAGLAVWFDYTGKADGTQRIPADGEWHELVTKDPLKATPFGGLEFHMMYARMGLAWKALGGGARIECKFVRGDGDETAFDERHFWRLTKSVPFQQIHWEHGEKGLAGRWFVKAHGGLKHVDVTTRYAKTAVVGKP